MAYEKSTLKRTCMKSVYCYVSLNMYPCYLSVHTCILQPHNHFKHTHVYREKTIHSNNQKGTNRLGIYKTRLKTQTTQAKKLFE